MTDDKEFIPDPTFQGRWILNPAYTGNKYELWKYYKCKVLVPLHGVKKYMKLKECYVHRIPSGQLYLSEDIDGEVCFTDAKEGVHFNLL